MLRLAACCVVAAACCTACSSGAVSIAFHPKLGAHYAYDVSVQTRTVTKLTGQASRNRDDDVRLHADQQVLEADRDGVRVRVSLTSAGGSRSTFLVRFDRAVQPAEVQQTEGLPSSVLGGLGLSEVFPAAAGAPPRRPLRPATTWSIDQPVAFGAAPPTRLRGSGRLVSLGVVHGRKVATVHTTYRLPVRSTVDDPSGAVTLDGTESIEITATRSLRDGAIERATAHTTGSFRIEVRPPAGQATAAPVTGKLTVDVSSTTRRVSA